MNGQLFGLFLRICGTVSVQLIKEAVFRDSVTRELNQRYQELDKLKKQAMSEGNMKKFDRIVTQQIMIQDLHVRVYNDPASVWRELQLNKMFAKFNIKND